MFIQEFKLKGNKTQYQAIDEAIRTSQFVRNKIIRHWMDNYDVGQKDLYRYNTQLREEFPFVKALNSHACQTAVERAWSAIARFYDNCKKQIKGKKGYPKFKKNCRSVTYKTSGWKLSEDRKRIKFTDKKGIGSLKMKGGWDLHRIQQEQIKRVHLVRRADGYYVQFVIKEDLSNIVPTELEPTQHNVGLDVGLIYFYVDSDGNQVQIPQYYRKSEKQLNRLNRRKSRKFRKGQKQTNNYLKARNRYARKHLRVSRQRRGFVERTALRVIQSTDVVAYEDLNVAGLVRNGKLAKSINDAAWSSFRGWLEYFGNKYGKITVAVPPHYTSQECSNCGRVVKKTLSQRTHECECGSVLCRDQNAAINILKRGLATVGHTEGLESDSINAWGDPPSTLADGSGCLSKQGGSSAEQGSVNQESPSF
ncbi:transposase, IS605 OrfB family [Halothece sp. PCC 7418]|uniref:RNA-guided endonuclease InsQ/TnpB family protein n=1 Tax=Halothece sp. (strain PCC 7418) TaxID=65093 RepID=UPI0002A065E9|nr:RNA-guided endonuclease TnpB family protein [Halothece sp. PCC 7418]AFZ45662.1 transposase, IS605 OrfB family [Halothece sp. PCC 7418]